MLLLREYAQFIGNAQYQIVFKYNKVQRVEK